MTNKHLENIDWDALSFSCTHEKDLWPKLDPKTDAWFKQARVLHKKRIYADKEIVDLYQKAADQNHFKAIFMLGVVHHIGDGVAVDEAKAVKQAERLIDMNIGLGYYQLATYLDHGVGVKVDKKASLIYARKAADLGNPDGQYLVGEKLIYALFGEPGHDEMFVIGKKMLDCALAQEYSQAGYALGMYYSDEDVTESLKYFQKAAALGHTGSLFRLKKTFRDGEYGAEKDPVRTACYQKLYDEADADKSKTFPNIDRICPLPPKAMP